MLDQNRKWRFFNQKKSILAFLNYDTDYDSHGNNQRKKTARDRDGIPVGGLVDAGGAMATDTAAKPPITATYNERTNILRTVELFAVFGLGTGGGGAADRRQRQAVIVNGSTIDDHNGLRSFFLDGHLPRRPLANRDRATAAAPAAIPLNPLLSRISRLKVEKTIALTSRR